MRSDLVGKWLSYFNKIRTSKICSMVKRLSHLMHIGGSSPFNKKEWVRKEWPMYNRAITVSSFLFVQGQNIHSFNTGNILYNLFSRNSSHSDCHSSNIGKRGKHIWHSRETYTFLTYPLKISWMLKGKVQDF